MTDVQLMGNEKYATKYSSEVRSAIGRTIKAEWQKMSGEVDSADQFIEHITKVLNLKGFKSPAGLPLTERGVRYQVFRNGIRFRGQRPLRRFSPPPPSGQTPAPKVQKKDSGVPGILKTILNDSSLSLDQRLSLIKAYFGVVS